MKSLLTLSVILTFLLLLPERLIADISPNRQEVQKPQRAFDNNSPDREGADIIILMDSSGSMKKTDPRNYRQPATKLFVSLLGESDRIGIVSFGDTAKVLVSLIENTKKNREALFNAVGKVSSRESSTNIYDAVKKGFDQLKSKPSPKKNRIIILMSDGKLALGSKEKDEAAFAGLFRILPELAISNIKLYTVAFTEMSDVKLIEDMAKETGGFFRFAKNDKDIHIIFASIFEKIKSPDTVPLEGEAFEIDKNIKDLILLINKNIPGTSTELIDPSRGKHTSTKYEKNIEWYTSDTFDMITVKEPAVGRWKVKLSTTEGNKVYVITNLNLKSFFDKSFVYKGDKVKIGVWLEKNGTILREKDVLRQASFSSEIVTPPGKSLKLDLLDNGAYGDDKADDGIHSCEFVVTDTGEYTIKIAAKSIILKREKVIQFKAVSKPLQMAKQITASNPRLKKKTVSETDVSWKSVLIRFGIINLLLLLILLVSAVYLFLKNRIYRALNLKTLKELAEAKNTIKELEMLKAEEHKQRLEVEEVLEVKAPEELQPPEGRGEAVDEDKYIEILKERDELITKMKEFEDKLQEKTGLLDEMEKKYKGKEEEYENLEKEYLILYRQQQEMS